MTASQCAIWITCKLEQLRATRLWKEYSGKWEIVGNRRVQTALARNLSIFIPSLKHAHHVWIPILKKVSHLSQTGTMEQLPLKNCC